MRLRSTNWQVLGALAILGGLLNPISAAAGTSFLFSPPILVNDEGAAGVVASTESSGRRVVAALGDSVYVAWADERVSPARVWFAKSEDGGASWDANVAVADSAAPGAFPSLAVASDGVVHIAWQDFRASPLAETHVARSTDGGVSFEAAQRVGVSLGNTGWDGRPALACVGEDSVYVAWLRHEDFVRQIWAARSTDGGATFQDPVAVENRCEAIRDPVIAAAPNGRVCVAWEDRCDFYGPCGFDDSFCGLRTYLATSANGAQSFLLPRPATPMYGPAFSPALALRTTGVILLAWSGIATREGEAGIYHKVNPIGGFDYASAGLARVSGATPDTTEQTEPSIALDAGGNPHVVWRDTRLGGDDVFFAASADGGVNFGTPVEVTTATSAAFSPSIAVAPDAAAPTDALPIVWGQDDGAGGKDIWAVRAWPSEASSVGAGDGAAEIALAPGVVIAGPNPARDVLTLRWALRDPHRPAGGADAGTGAVEIYDVAGRRVRTLAASTVAGRIAAATWDGAGEDGAPAASGIYFARVRGAEGRGGTPLVWVR